MSAAFDRENLLLVLVSLAVSSGLAAIVYELYRGHQHDEWAKALQRDDGAWHGGVIVPSANEDLLWEHRPGASNDYGLGFRVQINEDGFRGPTFAELAASPDARVVAFVGDSITFGWAVPDEATLPSLTEASLNESIAGAPYRALNFGVSGYDTAQVVELVRTRVMRYSPEIVVYVMCLNDFDLRDQSGGLRRYFVRPRSFLVQDIARVYRYLLERDYHRRNFAAGKETVFTALESLKSFLDTQGVDLLLVVMPVFEANAPAEYTLADLHGEILDRARGMGVDAEDMLQSFLGREHALAEFAVDPWHPNEKGNAVVAHRLSEYLRASSGDRN